MSEGIAPPPDSTALRGRPIRVLIAEDSPEYGQALADFIASEPSLQLVALAEDTRQAVTLARQERPDVALVDVRMPGGGGHKAARQILDASPDTVVLALSAYSDRRTIFSMLRAGAAGYLVKGASPDELVEAIHRCAGGHGVLSGEATAEVVGQVVDDLEERARRTRENRERVELIRRLLEGEGLSVVFQPIFDLRTGRAVGVEALARFAVGGARPPDAWFREAGTMGLRVDLEMTALHAALAHLPQIPDERYLAVNLSPAAATSPRFVEETLPQVPEGRLVIEVTEHEPLPVGNGFGRVLEVLRERGGRLAIDDAGAGFANLHRILRLGPDLIKLDVSLTRDLHTDPARRALARALVAFAERIDASVVAEGVESEPVLDTVGDLGISFGQGFHLARPAPLPARSA